MTNFMFDALRKQQAWNAARAIPGQPEYRYDCDGRLICWSQYGSHTEHGWEIDHVIPTSLGGLDSLLNIRARHWRGNSSAGGVLGSFFRQAR